MGHFDWPVGSVVQGSINLAGLINGQLGWLNTIFLTDSDYFCGSEFKWINILYY